MMRSSYNNGGLLRVFQVQCIWAKFTHLIWIYWLLMWYFVFLSNFGICYKCTVSYRYLLLRIAIHISAPVSAVYRCIVSTLTWTNAGSLSIGTNFNETLIRILHWRKWIWKYNLQNDSHFDFLNVIREQCPWQGDFSHKYLQQTHENLPVRVKCTVFFRVPVPMFVVPWSLSCCIR